MAAHHFLPPQIEVISRGYDDTEVIRVVGNASDSTCIVPGNVAYGHMLLGIYASSNKPRSSVDDIH